MLLKLHMTTRKAEMWTGGRGFRGGGEPSYVPERLGQVETSLRPGGRAGGARRRRGGQKINESGRLWGGHVAPPPNNFSTSFVEIYATFPAFIAINIVTEVWRIAWSATPR